jgi:cytochrome c biogenesis protein CcdA
MSIGSMVLAFAAGVLSILSPCVLPILPIVLAAASSAERLGPLALAAGLALSFTGLGLFVVTIGYSIGINADTLRYLAAIVAVAIGLLLMLPRAQAQLAAASGPIANRTDRRFGGKTGNGLTGQFGVGLLLGAVWSPCVGPTLGAASLLAAQGQDLLQVGATMFVFGLGAALPLLLLGLLSRETMLRWRNRLMSAGHVAKAALGVVLIVIGAFVLTGVDKSVEAALVAASPSWLTDLTTRF